MRYHVHSTGSDSGAGTYADPWQTVAKVNAIAGSLLPGDSVVFHSDGSYSDAPLTLPSVAGSSSLPITFGSYGPGSATLEVLTNTAHAIELTTCQYVVFDRIDLVLLTGAAVGAGTTYGVLQTNSTDITYRSVTIYGGSRGISLNGGTAHLEGVITRWAWYDGVYLEGAAAATFSALEAVGAGYDDDWAVTNADVAAGYGLSVNGTASIVGSRLDFRGCQQAIITEGTGVVTAHRVFGKVDRADQGQLVTANGSKVRLFDAALIYDYALGGGYRMIRNDAACDVEIYNSSIFSLVVQDSGVALIHMTAGAAYTIKNTTITSVAVFLAERESGATFAGTDNNWACAAVPEPIVDPDINAVPPSFVSVAAWQAAYENRAFMNDPGYSNLAFKYAASFPAPPPAIGAFVRSKNDARLAEVGATSSLLQEGGDLTTTYTVYGFATTDLFGNERYAGLWSIGAHEYPVDTYQSFVLNSDPVIEVDSPVGVESYAALLQSSTVGIGGLDFYVEGDVILDGAVNPEGMIGIWGLGSRHRAGNAASLVNYRDVYDFEIDAYGIDVPLEDTIWELGPAPGAEFDPRRILLTLSGDGTLRLVSGDQAAVPVDLYSPVAGFSTGITYTLRLAILYRGPVSGNSFLGGSYYDLEAYVNGVRYITALSTVIPNSWLGGYGYPLSTPAFYAGIYGVRVDDEAITMTRFTGRVTSNLMSATALLGSGTARDKAIAADRSQATNLLVNGGFTRYPREFQVVRRAGVVRTVDPSWSPPANSTDIALHVGIVLDASDLMALGSSDVLAKRVMTDLVQNLPADGTVIFTVVEHWGLSQAAVLVPNTVVMPATLPAVLSQIQSYTPKTGVAWAAGFNAMATEMAAGVVVNNQTKTAYNKLVVNLTDSSTIAASSSMAMVTALSNLHAIPGLKEVSAVFVQASAASAYTNFASAYFPVGVPVNSPIVSGFPYKSLVTVPGTSGAICLSVAGTFKPSTAPDGTSGLAAAAAIGVDLSIEAQRWVDDWANQLVVTPSTVPYVFGDAFQAMVERNPGFSLNVPDERPAEGVLGGWQIWGAPAVLEVIPTDQDAARDGGNLVSLVFSGSGQVTLAQEVSDLIPLSGSALTVAFSARAGAGQVRIDLVAVIDGADEVLGTFYSRSFGDHRRVVRVAHLPENLRTLEIQIRLTSSKNSSIYLAAVCAAQGVHERVLPYSESLRDTALPAGTVMMFVGDACPTGYRRLPGSEDRIPYGFTGDPNFHQRNLPLEESVVVTPYDSQLDLGIMIDGSGDQAPYAVAIVAWLQDLLTVRLPQDGRVRVVIVFTTKTYPGYELLPLTPITPATIASSIQPAIDALQNGGARPTFGNNDRIPEGINAVTARLAAANGERRAMIWNTSADYAYTPATVTALTALYGLDRFVECSAVALGNSREQVIARWGGGVLTFPQPDTATPGILFTWSGGHPGAAVAGAYAGQPYQAGLYISETFYNSLKSSLQPLATAVATGELTSVIPTRLGGSLLHDHAGGASVGSSTSEPDGFQVAGSGRTTTDLALPARDTAQIKPYPYNVLPNLTRPEDPPARAIGPNHRHTFNSLMSAMPPGFRVLFCEKL